MNTKDMEKQRMTLEEFETIYKERDAELERAILADNLRGIDKMYRSEPLTEPRAAEPRTTNANARQIAGNHYKNKAMQPWDVIDTLPHAEAIGFYRGNAIKYLMRAGSKMHNPARQDYEKALHYIEKLLETLR